MKPIELIPEVLKPFAREVRIVGSRATCVPVPTDTDLDVLALVPALAGNPSGTAVVAGYLLVEGWELGGSGDLDHEFESWTKGEINLILVFDRAFFNRFWSATTVAARLNILNKEDRKALFRAVLYSEVCGHGEQDVYTNTGQIPF